MKTLIRVELARLTSRRLLRWATIAVLAACALAGTLTFINSNDDPRAVAASERARTRLIERCIADLEDGAGPTAQELPSEAKRDPRAFCEREVWVEEPFFRYTEMEWILGTMAFPLMALGLLLGATGIGAEWPHRGVTTLLTWEPRRNRVLVAKMIAAAGSGFAWAFMGAIVFSLALLPAALFRGTLDGANATWLAGYAGLAARVGALAALGALSGTALATVGRNTAAAFGVAFTYLTAAEGLIRAFKPGWSEWLVGDNMALFLIGSGEVDHLDHSQYAAGLLLLAYTVALATVALMIFRRREIA